VFGSGLLAEEMAPTVDLKTLHARVGRLTLENDALSGAPGKAGRLRRDLLRGEGIANAPPASGRNAERREHRP
jgi:hypothetical protein